MDWKFKVVKNSPSDASTWSSDVDLRMRLAGERAEVADANANRCTRLALRFGDLKDEVGEVKDEGEAGSSLGSLLVTPSPRVGFVASLISVVAAAATGSVVSEKLPGLGEICC